jgi:glycosyltransferase involved in cell wall biosynthesis
VQARHASGARGPADGAGAPARESPAIRSVDRTPRATVIVPSFEHEDFVVAAVESALAQSAGDVEVLVIDDGSRDGSRARLAELSRRGDPRLRVRLQENRGLSRTLNRGLAEARGGWIKFLPSDDLLEPACLERQLEAVAREPALGVVFALPTIVDATDRPLDDPAPEAWFDVPEREHAELLAGLLERNFLSAPGALFSRDLARAVGGFDPSLVVAQDYDLWLRMLARAPARLLPERLVRVRWHGRNQSAHATGATEAERAYALVHALARDGLAPWIEWTRRARGGDEVSARLELAAALLRSGLLEVRPFARLLVAEARGLGAPVPADPALASLVESAPELARPGPWGGLGPPSAAAPSRAARDPRRPGPRAHGRSLTARLRALARGAVRALARAPSRRAARARLAPEARRASRPDPGPRPMHWVVLAERPFGDADGQRSAELARALVRRGERVTYAARFGALRGAGGASGADGPAPALVEWDVARLRALFGDRDERLRVLAQLPEAQVVGLAREARRLGARVLYDKVEAWDRAGSATWYARGDEEALIEEADDLIGAERSLVRSLAAAKRPVHYLPNDAWEACASSLVELTARPTVAVIVLRRGGPGAVLGCVESLLASRAEQSYRVVVVDDGSDGPDDPHLAALEESREIVLLRSALSGDAASRDLGIRATRSELVALVDAEHRASGPGWLEPAVRVLCGDRRIGAVSSPGAGALVVPRAVLLRTAGLDERGDLEDAPGDDPSSRIRAAGYEVAFAADLGIVRRTRAAARAAPDPPPARDPV